VLGDQKENEVFIKGSLKDRGLVLTSKAMQPLRAIPLHQLHEIHDHEEHFLRVTFIECLVAANKARLRSSGGTAKVNGQDMHTAILKLGVAIEKAPKEQFDSKSKTDSVCPYCT